MRTWRRQERAGFNHTIVLLLLFIVFMGGGKACWFQQHDRYTAVNGFGIFTNSYVLELLVSLIGCLTRMYP